MRPLRVLIVHDSLSENGGVWLTLDLAQRIMLGAAAEVFALQPVREEREAAVPAGVRLSRGVPTGGRPRSSGSAAVVRLLRAGGRADVVVSGSEVGPVLEALALEVAVIAARSGATAWELLRTNVGALVDDGSVPALAGHSLDRVAREYVRILDLVARRSASRPRPKAAAE